MGICWGDPNFPTPTHTGCVRSRMTLTISSTPSSETAKKTRIESKKTFPDHGQLLEESGLTVFTYAQLKAATWGFRTLLGEGGFGAVFKGLIDDKATSGSRESIIVAVKRLNQESLQGFQEWQTEILFLGRLSHPNVAKLLGYCYEDGQLLLVYEFASRGSLNLHLYGWDSISHPLPWDKRLKIALGVARGLAFLHSCEQKIIHRDVTPANILLDESFTAKLSDFGLTRFGPLENSHISASAIVGTPGYTAPEYLKTGRLYVKSDVYGFGVVLLELLVGRRVIDLNLPKEERNLVIWSQQQLTSRIKLVTMIDPKLKGNYSLKAATELAQLALKCVCACLRERPSMTEVVEVLEKIEAASDGLS